VFDRIGGETLFLFQFHGVERAAIRVDADKKLVLGL
jgi:hypothetical protein